MKLIEYVSDKIYNLYFLKSLAGNNSVVLSIIIIYLLNPNKIVNKTKSLLNKLLLTFDKNDKSDNFEKKDKSKVKNIIKEKENIIIENKDFSSNFENTLKTSEISNLPLKKNIKNIIKKSNMDPYKNDKENIDYKYNKKPEINEFKVSISNSICSTPMFTLRTYDNLDFYYNMVIHNFDTQKIYNLNMCKDIHKWMTSSYLSNEDLSDEFIPIYFIYKSKNNSEVYVYEYLKFFVHTNENGIKNGFIQKGNDYLIITEDINKLIELNYIKDLLNGEQYINYNLSCNEGTVTFLDKFLSLVLIPEEQIGSQLTFDISNYYENKNTYEYYMKTINSDLSMYNTSI